MEHNILSGATYTLRKEATVKSHYFNSHRRLWLNIFIVQYKQISVPKIYYKSFHHTPTFTHSFTHYETVPMMPNSTDTDYVHRN